MDDDELSRRTFLKLLGASLAMAGAGGCMQPPAEKIVPYGAQPPEVTPGIPLHYATSTLLDGYATGVLVRSQEGRPIKVEGNPEHPASLGATSVWDQASVLSVYDPDRAEGLRRRGQPSSWDALLLGLARARGPLRVLAEPTTSPLVGEQLAAVRARFPGARVTFHAALGRERALAASRLAFGRALDLQLDLSRARRIAAFDADPLASMPFSLRWARQFADARRLPAPGAEMNRLYVVEPAPTPTGSLADHRIQRRASDVGATLAALVVELLGDRGPELRAALSPWAGREPDRRLVTAMARDLLAERQAAVVIAGERQAPEIQALALLANVLLGSAAASFAPTALLEGDQPLEALIDELDGGAVGTLLILGGNPVYDAPRLRGSLARAGLSVCLAEHLTETAAACGWFVPAAHLLESWGDARAYDGTLSFVQPLIAPLHDGRTPAELLAALLGERRPDGARLLRDSIARRLPGAAWDELLQRGFLPGSATAPVDVTPELGRLAGALAAPSARAGLELAFVRSAAVLDGRHGNNPWLQELPDPTTKLTWGNAALLAPRTAAELGVGDGELVEVSAGDGRVRLPAIHVPGHVAGAVTLALGYGRAGAGESIARGVGADLAPLRPRGEAIVAGATLRRVAERVPLPRSQRHFDPAGRPIAHLATLAAYRGRPDFTAAQRRALPTLFPGNEWEKPGPQWAMAVDTSVCTGCSSCVVACQAENNVPTVGPRQVAKSREMHWLRIDRYHLGPADDPRVVNQPMLCQHCEHAPCEYPCPVAATTHSPDGLNEMTYNRCIGTRFCSNNCPYKVRRFNFFNYVDKTRRQLQRNPDVTVRGRGVMEKCTFCVQRIRGAEIRARLAGRPIAAGEVVTACQAACPTGAITFGSLTGESTQPVLAWRRQPRAYFVLHELGTRPRISYLAKIVNSNPELG